MANKYNIKKEERDSNFELLRILLMLVIIAHHYVVNSGITSLYDFNHITGNMIFLQIFGFGGKMAINIFIMITGYFMVKSEFGLTKWLKLWLEIMFYNIFISIILFLGGYTFSIKTILQTLFPITYTVQVGFASTFMFMYLMIPFINLMLHGLSEKQHRTLVMLLLYLFTGISTFSLFNNTFSELGWYISVYIIAAYISLYPKDIYQNQKKWISVFAGTYILICGSILVVDFVGVRFGFTAYYYMVINAHKFLAVIGAVSIFLIFKNLKIKHSKLINTVSTTTFGVLLIHANSDVMRQFLWKDFLKNMLFYNSNMLIVHAVCSVLGIYCICVIIDLLRIKFVETPFYDLLERKGILKKVSYLQNKLYD